MGISIFLITFFHVSMEPSNHFIHKFLKSIFGEGNIGNAAFFLLSAYGLCFSLNNNKISQFYKNRFKRIYPITFVYFCIAIYIDKNNFQELLAELPKQITGYSLFTNYCKAWFIQALTILYLLFPILYKLIKYLYGIGYWAVLLFCLTIISINVLIYSFYLHLALNFSCAIILGIITYLCEKDDDKKSLYTYYAAFCFLGYTILARNTYLTFPLLLLVLSTPYCITPCKNFFVLLGNHSLEIYLSQLLILPVIPLWEGKLYIVSLLIVFILIFLTSFLLNRIQLYTYRK